MFVHKSSCILNLGITCFSLYCTALNGKSSWNEMKARKWVLQIMFWLFEKTDCCLCNATLQTVIVLFIGVFRAVNLSTIYLKCNIILTLHARYSYYHGRPTGRLRTDLYRVLLIARSLPFSVLCYLKIERTSRLIWKLPVDKSGFELCAACGLVRTNINSTAYGLCTQLSFSGIPNRIQSTTK